MSLTISLQIAQCFGRRQRTSMTLNVLSVRPDCLLLLPYGETMSWNLLLGLYESLSESLSLLCDDLPVSFSCIKLNKPFLMFTDQYLSLGTLLMSRTSPSSNLHQHESFVSRALTSVNKSQNIVDLKHMKIF